MALSNQLGFKKLMTALINLGPYKYANELHIGKHPLNVHVYIILMHISIFGFNINWIFFLNFFFLFQFLGGDT
jgi:hypothetical protein